MTAAPLCFLCVFLALLVSLDADEQSEGYANACPDREFFCVVRYVKKGPIGKAYKADNVACSVNMAFDLQTRKNSISSCDLNATTNKLNTPHDMTPTTCYLLLRSINPGLLYKLYPFSRTYPTNMILPANLRAAVNTVDSITYISFNTTTAEIDSTTYANLSALSQNYKARGDFDDRKQMGKFYQWWQAKSKKISEAGKSYLHLKDSSLLVSFSLLCPDQGYDANCNFDNGSCCYTNPPNTTANCQWMMGSNSICSSTSADNVPKIGVASGYRKGSLTRFEKLDPLNCDRRSSEVSYEKSDISSKSCSSGALVLQPHLQKRSGFQVYEGIVHSPSVLFHISNKQVRFQYTLQPCPAGFPGLVSQVIIAKVICYPVSGGEEQVDIYPNSTFQVYNWCPTASTPMSELACLELHSFIEEKYMADREEKCPTFKLQIQGYTIGSSPLFVDDIYFEQDTGIYCGAILHNSL